MKEKGILLSLEALIALLLVVALIAVHAGQEREGNTGFRVLYLFQQENDLLKVYGMMESMDEKELLEFFNELFEGRKRSMEFNGRLNAFEGMGSKAVKSAAFIKGNEIELIVYH
ncbi:hypothetical protein HZB89_01295 [archaeon]|nr:hypothetical protein [archaeon]